MQNPPLAGLLYQSGYLTRRPKVTATPDSCKEVLAFPNQEVQQAFQQSLRKWYETQAQEWFQRHAPDPYPFLNQVRMALNRGDTVSLRHCLETYLRHLPYVLHRLPFAIRELATYETYYQFLLYMLFVAMGTPPQAEMPTVTSRLDLVVPLAQRIIVLELKVRQNATQALKQAFIQDYATPFQTRGLPVTLFGMQFDETLLVIQDFRRWELGTFNVATARWRHEPFLRSLSELALLPLSEREAYVKAADLLQQIPEPEQDGFATGEV